MIFFLSVFHFSFFFFNFLPQARSNPVGVLEDLGSDRDIELGGQQTSAGPGGTTGMKLG